MRLIDADALKERAIRVSTVKEHCYIKAVGTREIDKAPTVEATPVVHAKWVYDDGYNACTHCHNEVAEYDDCGRIQSFAICPHCGAKMD